MVNRVMFQNFIDTSGTRIHSYFFPWSAFHLQVLPVDCTLRIPLHSFLSLPLFPCWQIAPVVEQEVHEHVPLEETDTVHSALGKLHKNVAFKFYYFPFIM